MPQLIEHKENANAFRVVKELYASYWKELCGLLQVKFGSGPPDPEDVAQTAFLKFAQYTQFREVENPKGFLFRTASNLIIDYHRSPKNISALENDASFNENCENSDVLGPESVSMSRQEADIVSKVIMALPERNRAFLLMNRLEGMSYTDIAREAGMSRAGVQKIILQALEKCTKALKTQHAK